MRDWPHCRVSSSDVGRYDASHQRRSGFKYLLGIGSLRGPRRWLDGGAYDHSLQRFKLSKAVQPFPPAPSPLAVWHNRSPELRHTQYGRGSQRSWAQHECRNHASLCRCHPRARWHRQHLLVELVVNAVVNSECLCERVIHAGDHDVAVPLFRCIPISEPHDKPHPNPLALVDPHTKQHADASERE